MVAILRVFGRMMLAVLLGALIGLERTLGNKNAGVRTHAILALATCSLTTLTQAILPNETARVMTGIVQGIGFIGAGVIFTVNRENFKDVFGLTSSAILWLTGIVGCICGTHYWYYAFITVVCYAFITFVLGKLEYWVRAKGILHPNDRHKKD